MENYSFFCCCCYVCRYLLYVKASFIQHIDWKNVITKVTLSNGFFFSHINVNHTSLSNEFSSSSLRESFDLKMIFLLAMWMLRAEEGGSDIYSSEENVMWLSELEFKFASRPSYLVVKHYSLFISLRGGNVSVDLKEEKTKNAFVKSGCVWWAEADRREFYRFSLSLSHSKSPFNLVYI